MPITNDRAIEFAEWFHLSHARETGDTPRTLYHGTNRAFEEFWRSGPFGAARPRTTGGRLAGSRTMFFFSDKAEIAEEFAVKLTAKMTGANVRPVHLSLQNPLIIDATDETTWKNTQMKAIEAYDQGIHDGAIILNSQDGVGATGPSSNVYIAFDAAQIMSIFDPRAVSYRHAMANNTLEMPDPKRQKDKP